MRQDVVNFIYFFITATNVNENNCSYIENNIDSTLSKLVKPIAIIYNLLIENNLNNLICYNFVLNSNLNFRLHIFIENGLVQFRNYRSSVRQEKNRINQPNWLTEILSI